MLILKQFRRPQWLIFILIGLIAIGTLSYTPSQSAQAAETVIIVSQTVYCDRIDVTYQVIAAFPTDYAIITAHNGTTQLGSVNGTGTPSGTYSATVPVSPAQPAGTMLRVEIEINDGNGYFVNRVGSQVACYDDSNRGGGNTEPPSSGENPPTTWNGYTDGRLNPDMAEYYTVYCHDDLIYVHRANPPPTVTLTEISILDVMSLNSNGGSFNHDGITITRNDNQVTLFGANGNLAPASGSKTFSLNTCIEHNGGESDGNIVSSDPPQIPEACTIPENQPTFTIEWDDFLMQDVILGESDNIHGTIYNFVIQSGFAFIVIKPEKMGSTVDLRMSTTDQDDIIKFSIDAASNQVCLHEQDGNCREARSPNGTPIDLQIFPFDLIENTPQRYVILTATNEMGCTTSQTIEYRVVEEQNPSSGAAADLFTIWWKVFKDICADVPIVWGIVISPFAFQYHQKRRKKL